MASRRSRPKDLSYPILLAKRAWDRDVEQLRVLVLSVNGHKINAFPVVMLPSAALALFTHLPAWNFVAVASLVPVWTLGWGESVGGLHNRGQPTQFLKRLSHLMPNLGIAAAIWAFQQPKPLAFWVAASVHFASVQWLSKRQLDLFSFILGWLSLWGLTIGGHFRASVWDCMLVYTCCALLTVALLRLASGVEGRQLKQEAGTSAARDTGEIGFDA